MRSFCLFSFIFLSATGKAQLNTDILYRVLDTSKVTNYSIASKEFLLITSPDTVRFTRCSDSSYSCWFKFLKCENDTIFFKDSATSRIWKRIIQKDDTVKTLYSWTHQWSLKSDTTVESSSYTFVSSLAKSFVSTDIDELGLENYYSFKRLNNRGLITTEDIFPLNTGIKVDKPFCALDYHYRNDTLVRKDVMFFRGQKQRKDFSVHYVYKDGKLARVSHLYYDIEITYDSNIINYCIEDKVWKVISNYIITIL